MIFVTGKEFETLIDSHGPDHIQKLMQNGINAIEELKKLASGKDKENLAIESLQNIVDHLELEYNKKLEERQRNAKVIKITVVIRVSLLMLYWW